MANKPLNPAAFPFAETDGTYWPGMTLRDYFAGQAMLGLIASPKMLPAKDAAWRAYGVADAMLAEREKSHDRS